MSYPFKPARKQQTHKESAEQQAVIKWAQLSSKRYPQLKWLHSSQAGVKLSITQARIAKAEGLKAGIADLFLPYPNKEYSGLYIEMKRPKTSTSVKGKLSDSQREFLDYANSVGYKAVICYGAQEAILEIKKYLFIS